MAVFSPCVDFAFKKLFGSEANKASLQALINAILPADEQVIDLVLLNPFQEREYRQDKLSILDIKAMDRNGRRYNIEMQINDEVYYSQRALYYWSKVYASQLKKGDAYGKLRKTISIHILNFDCLENEPNYHNVFHLLNAKTYRRDFEDLEIHLIELKKFGKDLSELSSRLDYWTTFLTQADQYDSQTVPAILKDDPEIGPALEALQQLYLTEAEQEIYEAQVKWLRDENSAVETAHHKGFEQGQTAGFEQGQEAEKIAIACKLLEEGVSLDVIQAVTGLRADLIHSLKEPSQGN